MVELQLLGIIRLMLVVEGRCHRNRKGVKSMPQYRRMPEPGIGVGGLGSMGREEGIGDFWREN